MPMPATAEISSASEKAPVSCGGREAELALHGQEEDREGVVEDPPGDGLGDRERADDRPRPRGGAAAEAGALVDDVGVGAHAVARWPPRAASRRRSSAAGGRALRRG